MDVMNGFKKVFDASPLKQGMNSFLDWNRKHASRANQVSVDAFGDQDASNTQRNALRHSLWTGLMANDLGGGKAGPISGLAAKGIGYSHELLSNLGRLIDGKPVDITDTLHDTNNNAVGINMAQRTNGDAELIAALRNMSGRAPMQAPPSLFAPSKKQLTYTKS